MKETFIDSKDDMDWLFETHLRSVANMRRHFKSAIIVGNEDSPKSVKLYLKKVPMVTDIAFKITFPVDR